MHVGSNMQPLHNTDFSILSSCLVCNGFVNHEVRVEIEDSWDGLSIKTVGKWCVNAFEVPIQLSASK